MPQPVLKAFAYVSVHEFIFESRFLIIRKLFLFGFVFYMKSCRAVLYFVILLIVNCESIFILFQLGYALERNALRHLKELRVGLQRDDIDDALMIILRNASQDFEILGRTDWWTSMQMESKQFTVELLKAR